MNCDGFDQRMNELLDEHRMVDDDPVIQTHLLECDDCYQKLVIWQRVEGLISARPTEHHPADSTASRPWSRVAVLAAGFAIAIALTWNYRTTDITTSRLAALSDSASAEAPAPDATANSGASADRRGGLDPNRWWNSVEPGQWIAQTMPTVRTVQESVQESVRPLSRSFKQAVDLLTFGRAT